MTDTGLKLATRPMRRMPYFSRLHHFFRKLSGRFQPGTFYRLAPLVDRSRQNDPQMRQLDLACGQVPLQKPLHREPYTFRQCIHAFLETPPRENLISWLGRMQSKFWSHFISWTPTAIPVSRQFFNDIHGTRRIINRIPWNNITL